MPYIILFLLMLFLGAKHRAPVDYNQPIHIGHHLFNAEWANTPEKMQRGLMYRSALQDNQAMLFYYPQPTKVAFWMKNMQISLDLLFFDSRGRLLEMLTAVAPCRQTPCQQYFSSSDKIRYVVEINAHLSKRLNIGVGDFLKISFIQKDRVILR